MRLLLAEDDALLGAGLRAALARAGFAITWVRDGKSALDVLAVSEFAAVVLDMGLPILSGLEVLRNMRANGSSLPVLILTARDATHDKVMCFDSGADDFLVKTTDMEELIARLRALVRRTVRQGGAVTLGSLVLDPDTHCVTQDGRAIKISNREFSILRTLVEGAGRVLTRSQLEQALYGSTSGVDSNAVEVHIHNLRHKLGANTLKTIRGVGYTIARPEP
jgi:DNA-binding response OmpR family regulator